MWDMYMYLWTCAIEQRLASAGSLINLCWYSGSQRANVSSCWQVRLGSDCTDWFESSLGTFPKVHVQFLTSVLKYWKTNGLMHSIGPHKGEYMYSPLCGPMLSINQSGLLKIIILIFAFTCILWVSQALSKCEDSNDYRKICLPVK